jgi:autotransporter-associated beta strand protein
VKTSLRNFASLAGLSVGIIVLSHHGSSAWAANLLANGSFDAGTYSFGGDGAQDLPPGSTTTTGWTVITNHVAPIQASNIYSIVPEDGNVSLDLQGYTDSSPYGEVQQTIATLPGAQYQLKFWIGVQNDLSYAVGPASITAIAGSTSQSFTNSLTGPGNQWQQFTMNFAASNLATTISLSGLTTQGGDYIGLDNADVELVALQPATFWTGTNGTNWADSGNWSGVVPGATAGTTNTDTALFNRNAPHSPLAIDAGRNLQNITFDTANANSMTVGTIGGQALLLTAGGTMQTTSTVVNAQTVNAPLVLEGDYTFTSGATNSSATLSFGGGITPGATSGTTTLTLNGANSGANTISGVLADNNAGRLAVTKSGTGVWILSGANSYSGNTTVSAGTLKFNITSGTPTIAAGATATVASGATLELAGSVSALGSAGGNRTQIMNNSTALGLVVSGSHQQVGNIDGSGTTQVNAGSDLTANHIIQSALTIGGAAGSPALVTIDASDTSGNALGQTSGLASSLMPTDPFGAGEASSANLSSGGGADLAALSPGNSAVGGNLSAVPEPSTLLLLLLALSNVIGKRIAPWLRVR